MQLSYRGVYYDPTSATLDMLEGETIGKYRGQEWKYHYPRHIPHLQPKLYRQYRGIAYSSRPFIPKVENSPHRQPNALGNGCPVPLPFPRQAAMSEISQTHLENLRRNLERRLEAAQARGDEQLIQLLKQESQQLALNL